MNNDQMPLYQCHKRVRALKITDVTLVGSLTESYKITFDNESFKYFKPFMFSRYRPIIGDYYVVYDDGYESFSPCKAFGDGYSLV